MARSTTAGNGRLSSIKTIPVQQRLRVVEGLTGGAVILLLANTAVKFFFNDQQQIVDQLKELKVSQATAIQNQTTTLQIIQKDQMASELRATTQRQEDIRNLRDEITRQITALQTDQKTLIGQLSEMKGRFDQQRLSGAGGR